ncbi:hypothetical protein CAC42_6352 [Sphaceloma murrayae]|uniref:Gfd2/YDR514C-like C-terminal domain-containing protein n=1 Tax=Sphaceloma murrayae TaxID=2082308 RepID=A0A2K1QM60_9PEZI|nr:hypothetical protein CAC42_6352 [Sphaceloma murrayae]
MTGSTPKARVVEKGGHHRYVPVDLLRQLPSAVWKIHDYKKSEGVFNSFFTAEKFFSKFPWRFHFFWCNDINPNGPLILVHETYARMFIDQVQKRFPKDTRIVFPSVAEWPGLIADFKYYPGVEPQVLPDEPRSKDAFNSMRERLQAFPLHDDTAHRPELVAQLKETIEATATCLAKNKKELKVRAQAEFNKTSNEAMKKMQRALGLLPVDLQGDDPLGPLETSHPTGICPFQSPVIICVDVEAHERMKSVVTEIGIATLDTSEIQDIAPGTFGINWQDKIRTRHIRTQEYRHHVNRQFVSGCPDNFKFGVSEFVPVKELAATVATCFRPPFGASYQSSQTAALDPTAPTFKPAGTSEPKRNLILLGHDTDNDIAYLKQVGYDVSNLSNIVHVADTCTLYSALTGSRNKTRLGKILDEIDIDAWYLHNAGNDAWYTLAAAIGLAVGEREGRKFGDQPAPDASVGPKAVATPAEPQQGWSTHESAVSNAVAKDTLAVKQPQSPAPVEEEDLISFDDPEPETSSAVNSKEDDAPAVSEEDQVCNQATWIAEEESVPEARTPETVIDTRSENTQKLKEKGGFLAYMVERLEAEAKKDTHGDGK